MEISETWVMACKMAARFSGVAVQRVVFGKSRAKDAKG